MSCHYVLAGLYVPAAWMCQRIVDAVKGFSEWTSFGCWRRGKATAPCAESLRQLDTMSWWHHWANHRRASNQRSSMHPGLQGFLT